MFWLHLNLHFFKELLLSNIVYRSKKIEKNLTLKY